MLNGLLFVVKPLVLVVIVSRTVFFEATMLLFGSLSEIWKS